ncbi:MAG: glycosyltransferase family 2 protein, partial [bacterium]|nr:glycosyltransferase family 2 protein [bacterium]
GDIIIRMDAHATFSPDYISRCVQHLQESKADNVGGAMITLPRENTFMGQLIVAVLTSRFGVGNSDFRTETKQPKETDTVFGGCYRKEIFTRIGFFNEKLPRSQDMEFNLRLKKQGGRIILFPDVVSYYYARSDLRSFCRTNFRNGVWVVMPLKYSEIIPVSLRHFIPLLFVLSILAFGFLTVIDYCFAWVLAGLLALYLAAALYFSFRIAVNRKDWRYLLTLPLMFLSLHVLYGLGSFWALLQCLLSVDFWKNAVIISHPQKV